MTAHEIVAKCRNLPQASPAALKLVAHLNDSKNDFDEAVAVIKADGVLTAKLLRACNTSAFGMAERVASVDQALLLLGFNEVRRIVLSLGLGNALLAPLPGYSLDANALWRHAFLSATAAEKIVETGLCTNTDGSIAFTVGLLHDIGKILMSPVLTPKAQAAIQKHISAEGLGCIEAEREVLGTDHMEVGACLLHIWRLPESVVEAVANHHRPLMKPRPQLSAIAHLANRVAHLAEAEADFATYAFRPGEPIVQAFELNPLDLDGLIETARTAADRARELEAVV